MVEVLDELELTELVTSIPGVSAVGAAAMLAEPGDPTRFDSPARSSTRRAVPARQCQRHFSGRSRISRRGQPRLRLAAWRAVWGALPHDPVMAALPLFDYRQRDRLTDGQPRAAIAAALFVDPSSSPTGCVGMPHRRRRRRTAHSRLKRSHPKEPRLGPAPRVPEAPAGDLARHHDQAPPRPHRTRLHTVGNQTRLINYVEARTGQAPQPLTKPLTEVAAVRHPDTHCARN